MPEKDIFQPYNRASVQGLEARKISLTLGKTRIVFTKFLKNCMKLKESDSGIRQFKWIFSEMKKFYQDWILNSSSPQKNRNARRQTEVLYWSRFHGAGDSTLGWGHERALLVVFTFLLSAVSSVCFVLCKWQRNFVYYVLDISREIFSPESLSLNSENLSQSSGPGPTLGPGPNFRTWSNLQDLSQSSGPGSIFQDQVQSSGRGSIFGPWLTSGPIPIFRTWSNLQDLYQSSGPGSIFRICSNLQDLVQSSEPRLIFRPSSNLQNLVQF